MVKQKYQITLATLQLGHRISGDPLCIKSDEKESD